MENETRLIDFETARKSVMNILAGKITTPTAVKVSVAMQEATVDAVEVVHGRWQQARYTEAPLYICSKCDKPEYKQHNYCPNCGARMDGGE